MATVDELICEIQAELQLCTTDQLENMSVEKAPPEPAWTKAQVKGRVWLLGLLNRYLSSKDLGESDDQGKAKLEELKDALVRIIATRSPGESPTSSIKATTPLLQHHREYVQKSFNISGQIAGSQQKDGLTFTSLIHQRETGIRKGYPEDEVVEAVIKATNPGLNL